MIFSGYDLFYIFIMTAFLGFEVISKVPSILHTPLMSGSNAIHGIVLVGAMALASDAHGAMQLTLAFIAVFLATLNIVGGVVVTDRMLEMFKGRQPANRAGKAGTGPDGGAPAPGSGDAKK
jgi:proton-translocating NAD(P)+ transhydrogenase subunit alpha